MRYPVNLEQYRNSGQEKMRTSDLLRILPGGRRSVLDIGARDGHFSRLLTRYFPSVTALDLQRPGFEYPGVTTVSGDVTRLQFPADSFDCVFCAEVLEHIPDVETAAREIARVARHEVIVGVPYKQDTRVGQTTCRSCGKVNPPWGHVNTFDERRLQSLFPRLRVTTQSFIGRNHESTNWLSAWLMNLAGNPWGVYNQEEPCIHCGTALALPPAQCTLPSKICSALAARINLVQQRFTPAHDNWIHVVFSKDQA